jgi:hypothetical protein
VKSSSVFFKIQLRLELLLFLLPGPVAYARFTESHSTHRRVYDGPRDTAKPPQRDGPGCGGI